MFKGRSWLACAFAALFFAALFVNAGIADASGYVLESEFGSPGAEVGQLDDPYGLAVLTAEGADYLYVVDSGNDRVQVFDQAGQSLLQFGAGGSGAGELDAPSGIAIGPNFEVYVADTGNDRVQRFDGGGGFESTLGVVDTQLQDPVGVAVDPEGQLLVTEAAGNEVSRFAAGGAFVSALGSAGTGNGAFNVPVGVAVDPTGNVFVVDSFNHRVQVFSDSGAFVSQFGSFGVGAGQFDLPLGLAIGSGGVFVSDLNNGRIQRFSSAGDFTSAFGSFGLGTDEPGRPGWLAVGSDGDLYVSDSGRDRVQRYSFRNELTAATAGSGSGSVTSVPAGIDCGARCTSELRPGTPVTLIASPAPGSTFTGWSGGGCSGTGACDVVVDSDRTVTASFTLDRTLSVSRIGTGSGTVASSPSGLDCGSRCTVTVAEGTSITLTATPAPGSTFTGWAGQCSGTGQCSVGMGVDQRVTAEFTADLVQSPPPTTTPPPRAPVPRLKLTAKPAKKTKSRKAKLRFKSSVAGSKFKCRLDKGKFRRCRSPKVYKRLKPGRHKVTIRVTASGVDGRSVSYKWRVRR